MLDINEIRKNYERFDDTQIRIIAKQDAKGLREDVIPILIEEIKKRNLGNHLIRRITVERRKLSKSEYESLKRKVKESICKNCKKNRRLKGYKFTTITGILIDENISEYELIICGECGRKLRRKSAIWTILFGWWSLGGLLSTPFILINKIKASIHEDKQSEQIIKSFIESNIGAITIGEDSKEVIQKLLIAFNQLEEDYDMDEMEVE